MAPRPRIILTLAAAAALTATAGVAAVQPASAAVAANVAAPTIIRTACPGGVWAITTRPAKGFNPLTATTAQLEANNYPTPPAKTDTAAYGQWKKFVLSPTALTSACPNTTPNDHSSGGAIQTTVSPDGVTSTAKSDNWSGYMAHGVTYTEAEAQWHAPGVLGGVAGTNEYSSSWVGVGLGQSSQFPLMQAGTESDYVNGTKKYYLWYQVFPETSQVPLTFAVQPGDVVGAHIKYTSTGPDFHVWNTTRNLNFTFAVSGSWSDDGHAEWIYERTAINNKLPYLASAPPTFTNAQAVTGGRWKTLSAASDVSITMYNCAMTTEMAYAQPIQGTSSFTGHFLAHGDNNVCL